MAKKEKNLKLSRKFIVFRASDVVVRMREKETMLSYKKFTHKSFERKEGKSVTSFVSDFRIFRRA